MTLVLDGGMQESFPKEEVRCRRGDVLIKPPAARHRTRFGPVGARCLIVEMVAASSAPLRVRGSLFARVSKCVPDPSLSGRVVAELAMGDTASELVLEGLAMQLVGFAARSTSAAGRARRPPPWLEDVHARVRSDYLEKLTIAELAASAGVHPDHLGRAYRRRYGRSIGDMVRDLRLSWAAEQLTRTERALSELSLEAGFCDQSHFSRAFRRRFGVPPGRFRAET